MRRAVGTLLSAALLVALVFAAPAEFHFVLLGDRTGEAQAGIFEKVLRQAAATKPAFLLSVGDTIQGLHDATAESEWQEVDRILAPYRRIPLYLAPGNHDIWSAESERLFRRHAGHPPHYSFDYDGAHFAVVDNSRSDAMTAEEMEWLEADLRDHETADVKMVISHRPSWLIDAALGNTNSALHRMAKRYDVCCVIAGHVHQLIHAELEGVTYFAAPSAGGHLRLSGKYEDGWFFGWTNVQVKGREVVFQVHSLDGQVTPLSNWGRAGLRESK
uniref:Metallophosphoesterase n=1 Tax=Solibacter usitatus (strain Ellin6076) TaxID=234267 RepID=Q01N63_SOLUE